MTSLDPFSEIIIPGYVVKLVSTGFVMGIQGGINGESFLHNAQPKRLIVHFYQAEHSPDQLGMFPIGFNKEWSIPVDLCFLNKPILVIENIKIQRGQGLKCERVAFEDPDFTFNIAFWSSQSGTLEDVLTQCTGRLVIDHHCGVNFINWCCIAADQKRTK